MPTSGPGRRSVIDDPEMAQQVAECIAAGQTRQQIADQFGIGCLHTITKWKRNPRIRAMVMQIIEGRVQEVTRKVDSEIAARLQDPHELTLKELLDIRKEFLGGAMRAQTEKGDEVAVQQMSEFMENNPEAAALMERMFAGGAGVAAGAE